MTKRDERYNSVLLGNVPEDVTDTFPSPDTHSLYAIIYVFCVHHFYQAIRN